jgi:hypothetical protein
MNNEAGQTNRASDYLNKILGEAVKARAHTIELERGPDGLEICVCAGASGVGKILRDSELEGELIELVVQRAGLEERAKGKMDWTILGQDHVIAVEEYDSFGESCFRLKLGKPKVKSSTT